MKSDPHAATHPADAQDAPSAQPVLGGRYEILGLLGAGGMGNVYKARDRELDEVVALKVLRPELVAAPGSLERFRREVKLARKVTHPNIARVFDIGEHGGDRILTMELVDGEPLSSLIEREGALPIARVVDIAATIASAVGAAHAAGVIHRDLKPDNVLVAKDGRVVVTDFGIARAATGDASRTAGFVGTPTYMAPEQVEEGAVIDARADIYAFGALLYELLTGEAAWRGDSIFAVAAARLIKPPPDPAAKRPELPATLTALVLRCMARQPADRPASMAAVVDALGRITLPIGAASGPAVVRTDDGLGPGGSAKRVAVLPFEAQGLGEQRYVADGLTEDLIDALSLARALRVSSRGVVARYGGGGRDVREVGRELSVDFVIDGSVRRGAAGFRVAVRLVSVADGFQLWSRRFDVKDAELLLENEAIARAIGDALGVEIAPSRVVHDDPVTVDLYLRAREAAQRGFTGVPMLASSLFEEALARSPDEPRLLAGYALAIARSPLVPPEVRRRALEAADRATQLAPLLPDGHVASAVLREFQLGDCEGAVRPARRALRLAPNHAAAHDALGSVLMKVSHESARAHLARALELEPELEAPRLTLATLHALRGEWDAMAACVEGASAELRLPVLARFAFWRRDGALARALLDQFADEVPVASPHRGISERLLRAVIDGTASYEFFPMFPDPAFLAHEIRCFINLTEAEMAALVGDRARALDALLRADADAITHIAWLDGCPLLDPLREDVRFASIRERVAARAARVVAQQGAPLTRD